MQYIYTLLIFVFVTLTAKCQKDSLIDWQNDVQFLADKLVEIHPRFSTCGLPSQIENFKDSLINRLPTLNAPQITVELQKLLSLVGDGHTLLIPFGMEKGSLLRIPLMLWLFDDGLFVVNADDKKYIGKKIVSIGKLSVEETMKRLKSYISYDNEQQFIWAVPFYMTLTDFLRVIGTSENRDNVTLSFDDGTKKNFIAREINPKNIELILIKPQTNSSPRFLKFSEKSFWMGSLDENILYVQVNGMSDLPNKTLETFGKQLNDTLRNFNALILDLRLNNGGEASKADELFKTCVSYNLQGGKIAVLISRMTFSAAQTFASRIDQWTNAFFVGEPSGSKPNHYGNERAFSLPFSKIKFVISSGYNQPVTINDKRVCISPDVYVKYNSKDFFKGKDPVLERAIEELEKLH